MAARIRAALLVQTSHLVFRFTPRKTCSTNPLNLGKNEGKGNLYRLASPSYLFRVKRENASAFKFTNRKPMAWPNAKSSR